MQKIGRKLLLCLGALLLQCAAHAGTLASVDFNSAQLRRAWNYDVYLPTGYESSQLRYPVLYLLHGNGGARSDWPNKGQLQQTLDGLIASGRMAPAIVVLPDAGRSWYVDRTEPMESAIMQDLLPDVEQRFRTLQEREGRLLAGHSTGAYGAFRLALKYPERFAAVALLSPAIYAGMPPKTSTAVASGVFGEQGGFDPKVWDALNYPAAWDGYLAKKKPVPVFLSSGDDDLDILHDSYALYRKLLAAGQPAEYRVVDGGHLWPSWAPLSAEA
ncbi:MAG: alpha/beta fold hydrolase, partial [Comamonas sp.]